MSTVNEDQLENKINCLGLAFKCESELFWKFILFQLYSGKMNTNVVGM